MHLKRWLTALVFGPVLIAVVLSGRSPLFFTVLVIIGLVGHQEYLGLVFPGAGERSVRLVGGLLGLAVMLLPMAGALSHAWEALAGMAMLTFLFFLFRIPDLQEALNRSAKFLLGLFYVPLLLSFFVLIWRQQEAARWILFILGVVFLGDTGAFYAGRWWGKHRLYPRVSPAKTVEGAVGGLVLSLAFALSFSHLAMPFLNAGTCFLLAVVLNVLGQLGDLFESLVKRCTGAKDSGSFLPGHGGMMDRIDGVLFSVPALYLYIKYFHPG